jgi:hypothetical protein
MKKNESRIECLRNRLRKAIEDMHHNATPSYPNTQNEYESELFQAWLADQGSFEIDYINDGGAYGKSHNQLTRAERRERLKYAAWEMVSERFGKVYQYGRGGRTVAPEKLAHHRYGPMPSMADTVADRDLALSIRVLESFNAFVRAWNKNVANAWTEYKAENGFQSEIDAHDGLTAHLVRVWR